MIKTLLRISVSFIFLGLFVYLIRNEIPTIVQTLKGVHKGFLVVGSALLFGGTVAIAKRLQLIFQVHEAGLSCRETLSLTYIGFFFNNFLPTAIGGDIVKAYCASRVIGQKLKAATCILMDRFFGLLMFIVIPSVTVLFLMRNFDPVVPITVFSVLLFAVFSAALIFSKGVAGRFRFLVRRFEHLHVFDKFRAVYEDLHVFRHHGKVITSVCLLSLLWQVITIATIYLFIRALGGDIPVIYLFLLTPVVHLMSMIPSINGLGVREMGFLYFFQDSIGSERATALAILYLFLLILLGVVGGIIYMFRPDYHFRFREIAKAEAQT